MRCACARNEPTEVDASREDLADTARRRMTSDLRLTVRTNRTRPIRRSPLRRRRAVVKRETRRIGRTGLPGDEGGAGTTPVEADRIVAALQQEETFEPEAAGARPETRCVRRRRSRSDVGHGIRRGQARTGTFHSCLCQRRYCWGGFGFRRRQVPDRSRGRSSRGD